MVLEALFTMVLITMVGSGVIPIPWLQPYFNHGFGSIFNHGLPRFFITMVGKPWIITLIKPWF